MAEKKVKEGRYLINKDIPLDPKGEKKIKRGIQLLDGKSFKYVFHPNRSSRVTSDWMSFQYAFLLTP